MQQPDPPAERSPHASPVIPTEDPKSKSRFRRVFSKETLKLPFGKDRSKRPQSAVAAESLTSGRARESFQEQTARLAATAESMARPVNHALGRIEDTSPVLEALGAGGQVDHGAMREDDAASRRSDDSIAGTHSFVRGSAEAVRLGASSTASFGITPSVSCEGPSAAGTSRSPVQSAHVSPDPSKPSRSSPLVPPTEEQAKSFNVLGGSGTIFPPGESAGERRRRKRMMDPMLKSTIIRVFGGGPRELEGETLLGEFSEPMTEETSPELDVSDSGLLQQKSLR